MTKELKTKLHLYLELQEGETEEDIRERFDELLLKTTQENKGLAFQIYESYIEET